MRLRRVLLLFEDRLGIDRRGVASELGGEGAETFEYVLPPQPEGGKASERDLQ